MALPYVPSGCLSKYIRTHGKLMHFDLHAFGIQLSCGLSFMHGVGFLHLDLKPGNIHWIPLERRLYLVDFGMAEHVDASYRDDLLGTYVTAPYRPPELWGVRRSKLSDLLTKAVDYWCYGCVVFEAAVGNPAFPAPDCENLLHAYKQKFALVDKLLHLPGCEAARAPLGVWAACVARCLVPHCPERRSIRVDDWQTLANCTARHVAQA